MGGIGDPFWMTAKIVGIGVVYISIGFFRKKKLVEGLITLLTGVVIVAVCYNLSTS